MIVWRTWGSLESYYAGALIIMRMMMMNTFLKLHWSGFEGPRWRISDCERVCWTSVGSSGVSQNPLVICFRYSGVRSVCVVCRAAVNRLMNSSMLRLPVFPSWWSERLMRRASPLWSQTVCLRWWASVHNTSSISDRRDIIPAGWV